MKLVASFLALLAAGALGAPVAKKDRTIQKVIDLLQELLEDSKSETKAEEKLYWKFHCYCQKNDEEKEASIADFTRRIGLLEAKVEELVAIQGKTIITITMIKAEITKIEEAVGEAEANRKDAAGTFASEESDMVASIEQMEKAIKVLERLGGLSDLQLRGVKGASTSSEMQASLRQALTAAAAYLTPTQKNQVESLIQAFKVGSAQTWQVNDVVNMLKKLLEAFKDNLSEMRKAEKAAAEAYEKFIGTKKTTLDDLKASLEEKEAALGYNDEDLAAKREQLADMKKTMAEDEDFLAKLTKMCKEKETSYEERCKIRASEDAAVSEAINILTSEGAHDSFGKVKATSSGAVASSFLQMASSHRGGAEAQVRKQAKDLIIAAAAKASQKKEGRSGRLARIAMLLEGENPFTVVFEEIDKMLTLIDQEGESDAKQLDWCNGEREAQKTTLEEKQTMIENLEGEIGEIDATINDPETGLVVQINETETSLVENGKSQESETTSRKLENIQYQKYAASLQEATELLDGAITVLKKHYDTLKAPELVQKRQGPAPPETWDNEEKYEGQAGKGNKALDLLATILEETKTEATACHDGEKESQHAYEDGMKELKDEEADLQESLSTLKETLAEKRILLAQKKADLEATEADKKSIEEYVESLKFKCDFITEHFDAREEARAAEKEALEKAKTLLKGTPAYKKFEEKS